MSTIEPTLGRTRQWTIITLSIVGWLTVAMLIPPNAYAEEITSPLIYSDQSPIDAIDASYSVLGDSSALYSMPPLGLPSGVTVTAVSLDIYWRGDDRYAIHVANLAGADQDAPSSPCSPTPNNPSTVTLTTCTWTEGMNGYGWISALNDNLAFRFIRFSGTGNSADVDAIGVRVTYEIDPEVALTYSGSSTRAVGDSVEFTATWQYQDSSITYGYFYEDLTEDDFILRIPLFPTGSTGSVVFSHTFNVPSGYGEAYHPYVRIGGSLCTTPTASGCTLVDGFLTGTGLTILPPLELTDDILHPFSAFVASKYLDVLVSEEITFTYGIDPPCTITDTTFYLGYAPALQGYDQGQPISSTGTTFVSSFPRTNQPYSAFFAPYIQTTCSDSTVKKLYLGGHWDAGKAAKINVVTQTELDTQTIYIAPMLNGGATPGFSGSTGSSLRSNKNVYSLFEPVIFELNYHVPFAPAQVLIFPTGTGAAGQEWGTGASVLLQGRSTRKQLAYDESGFYQPVVRVISSNPAVYQNIFLGGEAFPNPYYQIYISPNIWKSLGSLFNTQDGVFGLDPSTFSIDLSASNNPILSVAAEGMSQVIGAGLFAANFGYNVLKASPVFSFFSDVIHPPEGSVHIYPSHLFGVPTHVTGLYTVEYADPDSGLANIENIIRAMAAGAVILFVSRSFFA